MKRFTWLIFIGPVILKSPLYNIQRTILLSVDAKMKRETIVLYPAAGIRQIDYMVELAKLLRCSATILLTTGFMDHPSIDSYISRISAAHPSITFLRLPPAPPPPPATSLLVNFFAFAKTNAPNAAAALAQISHSAAVKALVIDIFCTSAMEAVSSLRIPVHYFFPSGAAALALYSYFPKIQQEAADASFKDLVGVELRVPGNPPLKAVHMVRPLWDRNDPGYWEMLELCTRLPEARGILVNSFPELEPLAVKAVAEGSCFPNPTRAPSVYYIGPLIAQPHQSDVGRDSKECLSWLDGQPSKSVVYLCFGSRGSFSVVQLREIAKGLENSGQRFLWVVKKPPQDEGANQLQVHEITSEFDLESVLPSGFMERTSGRGLVVRSWAPQVEVLSRDSVGGFVSHCGWNSVLEAVVAGVPMVAWPLHAEQHVNRHMMVGEMKVAVAVEQRDEDGFVTAEEVEKRLREVMHSPHIRETSLKLKNIALAAVSQFGSSTKALANFLQSCS
ncbi:hypothetical protein Fmac_010291 [Flemingia macrophylla]|uniref:Glycosyltransferase n=1 Tax=Flemingia macrophylla TaxID=520843 RepID=A0ABD1MJ65_9FABA